MMKGVVVNYDVVLYENIRIDKPEIYKDIENFYTE